ncbi:hypothetical protein LOK49_LG06G02451 [Camellia lanceoleosa]|uniref:Uncharacterized protein n=1 Tax=Camellia lanceoleosa TaxID=1840588 RepID=A0ACC0HC04_9ERIC|nr:hypothetical protein LOK49_LG06G02451 [Camellia lanceoleosa]
MEGFNEGFARDGSWTDSSDTGVGSEFFEERRSAYSPRAYNPLSSHHLRCGLECYIFEAGFCLGKAIGEVSHVDVDPHLPRNIRYLRIEVWICLEALLISGFLLKFPDGNHHWIEYQYERLCRLCRKCGKIAHTDGQCATPFREGHNLIQHHLASVVQRLGPRVLHQEDQLMYTSRIRANADWPKRRSTRLARRTTVRPVSEIGITHGAGGSNTARSSHTEFIHTWENAWDQALLPVPADDVRQIMDNSTQAGVIGDPLQEEDGLADQTESARAIASLPNEPVNLVAELELMWSKWVVGLQSLGINVGRLMVDVGQSEMMNLQREGQWSTEQGVGRRLNIPYGERNLGQRALVVSGPQAAGEGGLHLSDGLQTGASSSRGQVGDYYSEGVAKVEGGCETKRSYIHDVGGVSDSVVLVSFGGRRRRKIHRGLVNNKLISVPHPDEQANQLGVVLHVPAESSRCQRWCSRSGRAMVSSRRRQKRQMLGRRKGGGLVGEGSLRQRKRRFKTKEDVIHRRMGGSESSYDSEKSSSDNIEESIYPSNWPEMHRFFIEQEAARMKDIWLSSPDHVHEGFLRSLSHNNLLWRHEDESLQMSGFGSSPYSSNSKTIDPATATEFDFLK